MLVGVILVFQIFICSANYAISDQILSLKDSCLVVWRCNTQVEVPGAKVELPVSTITSGESREWQEQAELLARGPPARINMSMPGRTGNFLALKMHQKSGSIGLSPHKTKFREFCLFSRELPPPLFHAEPLPVQYSRLFRSLMQGLSWSRLKNSVIKLKLRKLQK